MRLILDVPDLKAKHSPKWVELTNLIRTMLNADGDSFASFTRINRPDRNCNYRAPGTYQLTVDDDQGNVVDGTLTVEE